MCWNIKTESVFSVLPPDGKAKLKWGKDVRWELNLWLKKRSGRQQAGCLIPYPKATANLLKVLSTMESDFHTNMIGAIILI